MPNRWTSYNLGRETVIIISETCKLERYIETTDITTDTRKHDLTGSEKKNNGKQHIKKALKILSRCNNSIKFGLYKSLI